MWSCTRTYIFSVFNYINGQSRNTFTSLLSIIALTWNTLAWFTAQVCSKCVRNFLVNNASTLFHPYKSGAKGTAYSSHMFLQCVAVTFNTFIATNDSFSAHQPSEEAGSWSALLIFQLKAGNARHPPRSELWMRIIWMPQFAVGRPRPETVCVWTCLCKMCSWCAKSATMCSSCTSDFRSSTQENLHAGRP